MLLCVLRLHIPVNNYSQYSGHVKLLWGFYLTQLNDTQDMPEVTSSTAAKALNSPFI